MPHGRSLTVPPGVNIIRSMSIWNKVLLGLIAAALLPFFYLAARALKTQQYWEAQAKQCEKNLKDADEQNRKLVEADKLPNGNLGTDAARRELYSVLIGRGRVWNNCEPAKVDRATGHVKLKTDQPVAPVAFGGIAPHMTLHAVEEADVQNGGRYLGEFKVVQVIDKERTVELAPTRSLDADELTRLARSKGPWTMYEVMPVDKHEPFAGLNPQELKELLPASSLAEYEKDGQDAAPGDPEERVRGGKYVRRLRDYGAIYENAHLQRSLFTDVYESALRDQQYMDEALASAESRKARKTRKWRR